MEFPISVKTSHGTTFTLSSPTEYTRAAHDVEKSHTCLAWGAATDKGLERTTVKPGQRLVFLVEKGNEVQILRSDRVVEINGQKVGYSAPAEPADEGEGEGQDEDEDDEEPLQ